MSGRPGPRNLPLPQPEQLPLRPREGARRRVGGRPHPRLLRAPVPHPGRLRHDAGPLRLLQQPFPALVGLRPGRVAGLPEPRPERGPPLRRAEGLPGERPGRVRLDEPVVAAPRCQLGLPRGRLQQALRLPRALPLRLADRPERRVLHPVRDLRHLQLLGHGPRPGPCGAPGDVLPGRLLRPGPDRPRAEGALPGRIRARRREGARPDARGRREVHLPDAGPDDRGPLRPRLRRPGDRVPRRRRSSTRGERPGRLGPVPELQRRPGTRPTRPPASAACRASRSATPAGSSAASS